MLYQFSTLVYSRVPQHFWLCRPAAVAACGGGGRGEGMVLHTQPNPMHMQMELCAIACRLCSPVSNGLFSKDAYNCSQHL